MDQIYFWIMATVYLRFCTMMTRNLTSSVCSRQQRICGGISLNTLMQHEVNVFNVSTAAYVRFEQCGFFSVPYDETVSYQKLPKSCQGSYSSFMQANLIKLVEQERLQPKTASAANVIILEQFCIDLPFLFIMKRLHYLYQSQSANDISILHIRSKTMGNFLRQTGKHFFLEAYHKQICGQ